MGWSASAQEDVGIRFAAPYSHFVHADRPSARPHERDLHVLTIGFLIVGLETLVQTGG